MRGHAAIFAAACALLLVVLAACNNEDLKPDPNPGTSGPAGQGDLIVESITNVTCTAGASGSISADLVIRNIGSGDANIEGLDPGTAADNVAIQAMTTVDGVPFSAGGKAAGGYAMILPPPGVLAPGQAYPTTHTSGADIDPTLRPYLTVFVDSRDDLLESDETNNGLSVLLPACP